MTLYTCKFYTHYNIHVNYIGPLHHNKLVLVKLYTLYIYLHDWYTSSNYFFCIWLAMNYCEMMQMIPNVIILEQPMVFMMRVGWDIKIYWKCQRFHCLCIPSNKYPGQININNQIKHSSAHYHRHQSQK